MWHQITLNKRRTIYVILFLGILFLLFGAALGYLIEGTLWGVLFGLIILFISYIVMLVYAGGNSPDIFIDEGIFLCDKAVNPKIYNIVEEMCVASGLPNVPKVYILNSEVPNAFAFGASPKNSSICLTKGILKLLNRDELQGVIAHEISHIMNRDTMYLLYAGLLVNLITAATNAFLRRGISKNASKSRGGIIVLILALIFIILAPLFAQLFYLCLSRKREFLADACAARFTRYPEGLANALEKISRYETVDFSGETGFNLDLEQNFPSNNLFIKASCIIPLKNADKEGFDLFSTHPSTQKRIKVLKSMAGFDFKSYNNAYLKVTGQTIINKGDID